MELTKLYFGLANRMKSSADGFEWLSKKAMNPVPSA
jgi:hypothetical protein